MAELEALANSKFVDEEYEEAVTLFTQAIQQNPSIAILYVRRAATHLKLQNYTDAVADSNKAIEIDPSISKAYINKGIACFNLEEYATAKSAFTAATAMDSSNSQIKTWLRKCEVELADEEQEEAGQAEKMEVEPAHRPANGTDDHHTSGEEEAAVAAAIQSTKFTPPAAAAAVVGIAPSPAPFTPPPGQNSAATVSQPRYRHEWYQTPTHIVVTIFAKNVPKEKLDVAIGDQVLNVVIGKDDESYCFFTRLFGKVVPSESKHTLMATKIEIRLRKAEAIQWKGLECSARSGVDQPVNVSTEDAPVAYPTSRRRAVNWDKIEAQVKTEEKDENLEGDAALNKLFQDIYRNADEDTRRAMNKSFVESSGTVLSTNWKEVGSKKVEYKG